MLILKCVYKSREINIGSLEFSSCSDSSKFWQSHSLIHKLIEIPHQNMYNDIMPRHWYFLHEFSIVWFQKISIPPPWKGFFLRPPPPLWKFQLSFIHFFKFFWPYRTPHPPGNSNGGSMDIFWNCTLKKLSPIKKVCFPKLDENTVQEELVH